MSIGTLRFDDGAPLPETAETVYGFPDHARGVDTFLEGMPAALVYALNTDISNFGVDAAHKVLNCDKLKDAKSLLLAGNSSTLQVIPVLDLKRDGPTGPEGPPGVPGMIDDACFRYITDPGAAGPDHGRGGGYLILPPDNEGDSPSVGFHIVRPPSYRIFSFLRISVADGLETVGKTVGQNLKIYPRQEAANPPAPELISGSVTSLNTVHANNFRFDGELDEVNQYEPLGFPDPEIRGRFASIGIEKRKPFDPDARMRGVLEDAMAIGNAAARSIVWRPRTDVYMHGA